MKIEPDAWLAGVLGYPVFRVEPVEGCPPSAGELPGAAGGSRALFYTRIPADRVGTVAQFTDIGFRLVDVTMTFEREPGPFRDAGDPACTVRPASLRDRDRVLGIAGSCFVHSRFHADPLLPGASADAVKRAWVANYFTGGRGEALFVAERGGEPIGFLALMATGRPGERTRIIDLIGVDRKFQGRGAGTAMVGFFIRDSAGRYTRLRAGTQVANLPSLRLYGKCGFQITGAAYVLHAHVNRDAGGVKGG
jgi:RimJ/RimL family protein N-acetyltransferase